MENNFLKYIRALAIFAILIGLSRLLGSIIYFSSAFTTLAPPPTSEIYWKEVTGNLSKLYSIYLEEIGLSLYHFVIGHIYMLAAFIAGIGIIFLRDWARILLIVASIVDCIMKIQFYFYLRYKPTPMGLIYLAFFIYFIYYFTRPAVKEQFARQESSLKSD